MPQVDINVYGLVYSRNLYIVGSQKALINQIELNPTCYSFPTLLFFTKYISCYENTYTSMIFIYYAFVLEVLLCSFSKNIIFR